MIEKLNYDFYKAFERGDKQDLYDGIVEVYGKLNEVIDSMNNATSLIDILCLDSDDGQNLNSIVSVKPELFELCEKCQDVKWKDRGCLKCSKETHSDT